MKLSTVRLSLPAVVGLVLTPMPLLSLASGEEAKAVPKQGGYCAITATNQRGACGFEANADLKEQFAVCNNVPDRDQRIDCKAEARSEWEENRELCGEQFDARLDVCEALGPERYAPDWDPSLFVSDPTEIGSSVAPNPYFPLVPGHRWVYEDEDESIVVTVTDKTKLIEGVRCITVNDIVAEDGEPIEDTDDWYAQDLDGNVWYCGEISKNYELFEGDDPMEAELVDVEGSWKTGREGAKPGIIMFANPVVGTVYRQEYAVGEAEDIAEIVSVTGSESAPAGSCSGDCLVTLESTPIEPDVAENKYYAPGIGLILETDPEGGRVELVEFSTGN